MNLTVHQLHKSLSQGSITGVSVAPLTVLTGTNGAGKTNLLEAIAKNYARFDDLGHLEPSQVRLFRLGELLAAVDGPQVGQNFKENWAQVHNLIRNLKAQQSNIQFANQDEADQWIMQQVVQGRQLSPLAIAKMESAASKKIVSFDADDFQRFSPIVAGIRDPFAASIAEVFLSYQNRRRENDFALWRKSEQGIGDPISTEEFVARFGPEPWRLLDNALAIVKLPYRFVAPPLDAERAEYEVLLHDASRNLTIGPADLSSGERVLLAVAMSLFTGAQMAEAIELPRVLLLDEADASLHPSMVKSLLTVLEEVFVREHGVRVIMTTHAPSTVALAPEESIFVMSSHQPRLRKATQDEGLAILTVGVPALSIRWENRRQIFVESEHDQALYQDLYRLLKPALIAGHTAEFIAAGKRESGGGCDSVKRFVAALREAGNGTVLGLIDRDDRQAAPEHIDYVADRYAIENIVLDPLLLGAFLLRERVKSPEELGLSAGRKYFELDGGDLQPLADSVSSMIGMNGDKVAVQCQGDISVLLSAECLNMRGHDYEDRVLSSIPALRQYKGNHKREIVNKVVADLPWLAPKSLIDTFERLLA